MAIALTPRERRGLWITIGLLVAVRFATLPLYPVMDPTESRYAEIARKMLETGDWLMPQIAYGVPFWGKPPLSTWLSAVSMAAFGVNEFAARLPSLLLMLGCGALVFMLARLRAGRDEALLAAAFFATTVLVFIAGGAVMTDEALALGTTLAMVGFWIAVDGPPPLRRAAGFAFFVGLAIGMMAKGPIALVLTFVPIGAWTLWTKSWRDVWTRLPWITGTCWRPCSCCRGTWRRNGQPRVPRLLPGRRTLEALRAAWLERRPLRVGARALARHDLAVLDRRGAALVSASIGWLGRAAVSRRHAIATLVRDRWQCYLLLWTVAPMLFFTLSGNILATYVLPGIPAFALLLVTLWRAPDADAREVLRRHAMRWPAAASSPSLSPG